MELLLTDDDDTRKTSLSACPYCGYIGYLDSPLSLFFREREEQEQEKEEMYILEREREGGREGEERRYGMAPTPFPCRDPRHADIQSAMAGFSFSQDVQTQHPSSSIERKGRLSRPLCQ